MSIVDIITKKKDNKVLTEKEIKYVVDNYVNGNIKDYQMSALLMAIVINGMNDDETSYLTKYMADSGAHFDLSDFDYIVDKHSTGGVGDKTTLIIAPLVASCNVTVAKMSGRALGYTGGTIDKLESIKDFKVNLSEEEFINQLKNINVAITSQTKDIAIADKKIYALRDATGTVESIPLIASSIMSKKIAMGAKNLVIDLKVGSGALIKNINDARYLANIMINIGKKNNIKVVCLLTNMNVSLGSNVGNSLEVIEAIDILKNNKDNDLRYLCIELASYMVKLGLNITYEEAKKLVTINLDSGKAYDKFTELVKYQKGDLSSITLGKAKYVIKATTSGYITNLDALSIGKLAMSLGAGRSNKEDSIDYEAGVILHKKNGDYVEVGDIVMSLYTKKDIDLDIEIITSKEVINNDKLIYEVIF